MRYKQRWHYNREVKLTRKYFANALRRELNTTFYLGATVRLDTEYILVKLALKTKQNKLTTVGYLIEFFTQFTDAFVDQAVKALESKDQELLSVVLQPVRTANEQLTPDQAKVFLVDQDVLNPW